MYRLQLLAHPLCPIARFASCFLPFNPGRCHMGRVLSWTGFRMGNQAFLVSSLNTQGPKAPKPQGVGCAAGMPSPPSTTRLTCTCPDPARVFSPGVPSLGGFPRSLRPVQSHVAEGTGGSVEEQVDRWRKRQVKRPEGSPHPQGPSLATLSGRQGPVEKGKPGRLRMSGLCVGVTFSILCSVPMRYGTLVECGFGQQHALCSSIWGCTGAAEAEGQGLGQSRPAGLRPSGFHLRPLPHGACTHSCPLPQPLMPHTRHWSYTLNATVGRMGLTPSLGPVGPRECGEPALRFRAMTPYVILGCLAMLPLATHQINNFSTSVFNGLPKQRQGQCLDLWQPFRRCMRCTRQGGRSSGCGIGLGGRDSERGVRGVT